MCMINSEILSPLPTFSSLNAASQIYNSLDKNSLDWQMCLARIGTATEKRLKDTDISEFSRKWKGLCPITVY